MSRKAPTEAVAWVRRGDGDDEDDCCDPANNGLTPPSMWFDVEANTDGDHLAVRPKIDHPCGIKNYWVRVSIFPGDTLPSDSWHTEVDKNFDKPFPENPKPELKWGPGEAHNLPVNLIGMTVRVDGYVTSRCNTTARVYTQVRVVAGPV